MWKSEAVTAGESGEKVVFMAGRPGLRTVSRVLSRAMADENGAAQCRLVPMENEVEESIGQEKILVLVEQTNAEIAGLVLAKRKKDVEEEDDLDDEEEEDDDVEEDEDEDEDFDDDEEDEDEFEEEFEDDELDDDDDDIFYDDDDDE
jgi:hypothetical protein